MTLHFESFAAGVCICAAIAYAWMNGRESGIRLARRIHRHGRSLDSVFFEDAERDPTIERPAPARAEITPMAARLPQ